LRNIISRLILFTLVFCPLGPFLFRKVDIWDAQGYFIVIAVLLMFGCSFYIEPLRKGVKNLSLGILLFCVGLQTVYYDVLSSQVGGHTLALIPFSCFLIAVLFYRICVQYLNKEDIETVLRWMFYTGIATIVFCILQKFGLSQFLKESKGVWHPETDKIFVTGLVGNPVHLSAYLGMCLPLFFGKKILNIISVITIWIILLFWAGMSFAPAMSGIIIGIVVSFYYLFKINKKAFVIILAVLLVAGGFVYPHRSKANPELFSASGRIPVWKEHFELSKDKFIVGKGLGSVSIRAKKLDRTWRMEHLHNEFFHFTFELGFLGLLAILFCIWEWFRIKVEEDKTTITIKAIFVGFLFNCLFLFPAHIWMVSIFAVFIYASLFVIQSEENYENFI